MIFIRKVYLTLLFILTLSFSYGQINLDSLRAELSSLPDDTASINAVIKKGLHLRKINLDAGVVCLKHAVSKAKLVNNKYTLSKALLHLGATYNIIGDFGSAAENLIEGLRIAEKLENTELLVRAYLSLGNMYCYSQQTQLGKGMYYKALKLTEASGAKIETATLYNNLGALTYRESNLDPVKLRLSISYLLKALALVESTSNQDELIGKYNNLGLAYCDLNKYDSALYYLEKSKKIIDNESNPDDYIYYYNYIGRIYTQKKEYAEAEKAYLNSIEQAVILNDREWIYEGYLSLAIMYENQQNYQKAFEYYRRHSLLKDSIVNESNFAVASDIKNKFEREKKEVELNQLKTEQSKQKIFNVALILVSILTVLSGLMMYSRFKIKSVSENKLKIQNEIISQKNKDIMDSINYARKIQQSVLPQEKYIEREIKKLKG
jgi:tetratricopeptide (TPR) repeat protein